MDKIGGEVSIKRGESARIRKFRLLVAKAIPKFPNDRSTLQMLEAKSLGSLLIDYANWAYRLIPPRPRSVIIEPSLTADRRWKSLAKDTKELLQLVAAGDDLNQRLSEKVFRRGFTPTAAQPGPDVDRWEDKDLLLNVMGYHHLNLSTAIDRSGLVKRTNDVLFAQVTRDKFYAIGFFDHSVFKTTDVASQTMTDERIRLWQICESRNNLGQQPGVAYVANSITTSGHNDLAVRLAQRFAQIIAAFDPKLDDLTTRAELFPNLSESEVRSMKLEWRFNFLDLGLCDHSAKVFHILQRGLT
jgi:hypothetical protein